LRTPAQNYARFISGAALAHILPRHILDHLHCWFTIHATATWVATHTLHSTFSLQPCIHLLPAATCLHTSFCLPPYHDTTHLPHMILTPFLTFSPPHTYHPSAPPHFPHTRHAFRESFHSTTPHLSPTASCCASCLPPAHSCLPLRVHSVYLPACTLPRMHAVPHAASHASWITPFFTLPDSSAAARADAVDAWTRLPPPPRALGTWRASSAVSMHFRIYVPRLKQAELRSTTTYTHKLPPGVLNMP